MSCGLPPGPPSASVPTPASNSASSNADFSFRAFGEYSPALHPKFFEDPRRATASRRIRNALPGASRHLHHPHPPIKIIRQRPPHPLKFIPILPPNPHHRPSHPRSVRHFSSPPTKASPVAAISQSPSRALAAPTTPSPT